MATRPFNCSENGVNPWGIFGGWGSALMRTTAGAGRAGATVFLFIKEVTATAELLRKATGVALTNAVFILELLSCF